uniref:Uncharacterized protein n=1 Tax=Phocoena sinus TaxID=42100 RepID=A0A8C9BDU9_PHOSS
MNPVYSPGSSAVPYANAKEIGYPAGFPMGYPASPAYSPNTYSGANPTFQTGYTPGTPYKEWKRILQLVSSMHSCNVCSLKVISVKVNFFIEHLKSL